MKRKTAKEILAESFRELAAAKSIDRITVQEIVDNCGYSPATFYRHFKDKYDLIAWDYAQRTAAIMDRIGADYSWKQSLLDGAKHYAEEKDYLTNLLLHTSGHDSFIQYMAEINSLDSGTLAPLLKRLEKQGLLTRVRPEDNERTLFLSLTEEGEALREKALSVPPAMQGCLDLEPDEMMQLKRLLDKALIRMDHA